MTTMDESQLAVSLTLRPTEICTAAAEVWDESQVSTVEEPRDQRRVLAVVTHRYAPETVVVDGKEETSGEQEEGCLFVMKYKSPSSPELYPHLLFPITPEFTASLTQANDGSSSLNASEFKLTLKIPKGTTTLGSNQMHTLSAVLEESRRLKKLVDPSSVLVSPTTPVFDSKASDESAAKETIVEADELSIEQQDEPHERHWEWLHFYLSHKASRILPSQKPKPDDIRIVRKGPKLSASSAGLPVDEHGDIALIRDQWVSRQLAIRKSEYSQPRTVSLRIGTFNVNGKPPSESLASWVRHPGPEPSVNAVRPSSESNPPDPPKSTADKPDDAESPPVEIPTENPTSDSLSLSTDPSSITLTSSDENPPPSTPPSSVSPEHTEDLPDILVLGFQELDISTEALLYSTSTLKAEAWISAIFDALGKDADDYIQLAYKQLVGVLTVVIIRKELKSIVKEVSSSTAGVGIMGIMGNKGATAFRLRLNSTTVTFVCSHLAAFDEFAEKRNSDFAEICRKLQFPITWKGTRNMRSLMANVWETDVLFWLVNLNYRIDLPDQEVRSLLASKPECNENGTLLAYDQLKTAARNRRAFADFAEQDITFLPTYRFADLPSDELGYDLKRRPAWTDRVLHLTADPQILSQISYQGHPNITLSDHKPVSADFNLQLEKHDPHELHRVAMSIFKSLGDFEDAEETPSVTLLDGAEIDLGQVSYPHPVSREIRFKNERKVACAFRFVPLEPGTPISKEWLKVEPISGILLAEQTQTVTLTINIDKRTASFLNHGNTKLEDNIILHLAKGTDHVISVAGSYQPTCFANSLAWLVRSPGPIRGVGNAKLLPEANTLSAPRELMFLVEWLITNAQDVTDLFLTRGDESLVTLIREHMDTQSLDSEKQIAFPEGTDPRAMALAFAEAMLQFLDSLTEPVIPWVLHPRCALAVDREDAFEILDHVPSFARNVYVTVTAFLHFIGQSGGPNKPAELAKAFSNVLLRDDPRAPSGIPALTPLGKRNFLLHTIA